MSDLKFNSLINLELTQESGQTSQPPWRYNLDENMVSFTDVIYLKNPSIIDRLNDDSLNLNKVPILLKTFQNKNDLNSFEYLYELPKKIDNNEFSIDLKNFSKKELSELESEIGNEIRKIYNLDFDLEKFYEFLSDDEKLVDSIGFCNGLRLFLAKDPFECVISSICSANNSIARWTKSIDKIKHNWGRKLEFDSGVFNTFPYPDAFMDFFETPIEEADADGHSYEIECYTHNLKSCGVGYRAPYMKKAGKIFHTDLRAEDIFKMDYDEAFEAALEVPGVGPKVADCILLYGFGFMEAFPSDVWIKRIISHLYFDGEDISADKTREFGMDYFGDYAGYAQLYLFHYARKSGLMEKIKNK